MQRHFLKKLTVNIGKLIVGEMDLVYSEISVRKQYLLLRILVNLFMVQYFEFI